MRLVAFLAVLLYTGSAAAQGTPTGETYRVRSEDTVESGRIHINASLLGWQFSSPEGGAVSTFSVVVDLHPRLSGGLFATMGFLGFAGGEDAPLRVEGRGYLIVRDQLAYEDEEIDIRRTEEQRTYVKKPMLNRNQYALVGGLIYGVHPVKTVVGGSNMTQDATSVTLAVGIGGFNSHGFTADIEGVGRRFNHRWINGNLDLLFDASTSYDMEPDDPGSRFGARLWSETNFLRHAGLGARLEIGKYPRLVGWVLLFSIGGSLNID